MRQKWGCISKKTITVCIRIIETFVAFVIVAGGLALGRLYTEPVQMESLLPVFAERLIPAESGLNVQAESVILSAGVDKKGLVAVSIRDLRITRTDGSVVTQLPEVEMVYTLWDVLTLDYVPSVLTFKNAFFQMIIDQNGQLYIQNEANIPAPKNVEKRSKKETLQVVDAVIRYLLSFRELSFENAKVVIDDRELGEKVSMPVVNMKLSREFGGHHALSAKAALLVEEDLMDVTVQARLNRRNRKMDFKVEWDDVSLNRMGRVFPFLAKADLVVAGQMSGSFDFNHPADVWADYFKGGTFQMKTLGPGTLNLPEPLTNEYHVKSALIRGAIGEDMQRIKVAQSTAVLQEGIAANIEMTVDGLDAFFETGDVARIKTVLKSNIQDVPMDLVPAVWPSALGPTAHQWVQENLKGGQADTAVFTLYFTGGELVDLLGDMAVAGVRVRYLDEMTPVEKVGGQVLLYPDRVRILANTGSVGSLQLQKADVDLRKLSDPVSEAHITLSVTGPVIEAMRLIAEKPLEFPQMFGILPEQTGGQASADVALTFPLIKGLEKNQVQVNVQAKIKDGLFETPIPQVTLTNGQLDLRVTNTGLSVSGKGSLAGVPVDLVWDEFFTVVQPEDMRSHYRITGQMTAEQAASIWAPANGWMNGVVDVKADVQVALNHSVQGKVSADMMSAELFLYPISVMKAAGVPMALAGDFSFLPIQKEGHVQFDLSGYADAAQQKKVQVLGSVQKGEDFVVQLDNVIAPESDFKGSFKHSGNGDIGIRLTGTKWDMSAWSDRPQVKKEAKEETDQKEEKTDIPNVQAQPPNVDLDIQMDTMTLVQGKPLKELRISGRRNGYFWQNLDASVQAGSPVQLAFQPDTKKITASVKDVGNLLAYLGVSERIVGGTLTLEGKQPAAGGLIGTISAKDFSLEDPGFFVQAVTILGIVDAIRGKDMLFKKAEIPFEITPYQTLYLKEGYAYGTNLGLTFKGRIRPNELDLVGSVIPAYAINSLPGKIPLIGSLFKDGAGGGLVGVKYEVKGTPTQPNISFNPLSSIAPGIIGNLFQ